MVKRKYCMALLAVGLCLIASPSFAQLGIFDQTADWSGRGSSKVEGRVEVTGSGASAEYRMFGNGDDIWEAQDEGFFVYTEKSGSWSLQGKVQWWDQGGGNDWCKIGVMIREEGDAVDSRHYWIELRGAQFGDRTDAQWRTAKGGSSGNVEIQTPDGQSVADPGAGLYLRVTRFADADLVLSEYSFDGEEWEFGHMQSMAFPDTVSYGLAITNHLDNDLLAEAVVTDVVLKEAPPLPIVTRSIDAFGFKGGETIDVSLEIVNPGDSAMPVNITDTIPEGFTASDPSDGGTVDGTNVSWDISVEPGSTIVTYKVEAPTDFEGYTASWSGNVAGIPIQGIGALGKIGDGYGIFEGSAELVPYQHATRGTTHAEGWAAFDDSTGEYEVGGNGWDLQETEDEGFFLFSPISGSFRVEATVDYGAPNPHDWTKIGLMVRESLDPGSPDIHFVYRGLMDLVEAGERLSQNGGFSYGTQNLPADQQQLPVRLALSRFAQTNTFVMERLDSETNEWVTVRTVTNEMPSQILWGLAASSHVDDEASWGVGLFTDVVVETVPFGAARTLSSGSVAPGGSLTVTVEVNVEEGVTSDIVVEEHYPASAGSVSSVQASIGTATDDGNGTITWNASGATGTQTLTYTFNANADAQGEATFLAGTAGNGADYSTSLAEASVLLMDFENPDLGIFNGHMDIGGDNGGDVGRAGDEWAVVGLGADIWGTADQFHYLYKQVEGNFTMRIEDVSVGPTGSNPSGNDWQKMGIMARESLDANAAYAYAMLRFSDQAYSLQWRDSTEAGAAWDGDASQTPLDEHEGRAIILERDGPLFVASYVDASGNVVENNMHEVPMEDPIYVGIAVTSHQAGATSAGFFSNVQFEGTAVPVRKWYLY